jgi:hypothetical protein
VLVAHWGCITNGKEASSYRTGWFAVADVWDWSPLVVNEASHGLGGEEVKTPTPPCTISIVGPEHPLWFCLRGINSKVLNHLSCSLDLQQVLGESRPFPPLFLKLALLCYL